MTDLIVCPCCRGTGRVELTGEYASTLALVRSLDCEVTGAEIGRLLSITGMAACNRLVRLENLGLLTSRRFGRKRLYRPHRKELPC